MEEKNLPEGQPQAPAKAPVNEDVKDFMALVQGYGKPAAIAVILAALAFFVVQTIKGRNERQVEADSAALFQAQAPEELLQIAQQAQGATAPVALSMAASQLLAQERFDEAQAAFQEFLTRFPEHEFAPQAAFGAATCMEGLGDYAAAAEAYGTWLEANGGTQSAVQAVLAQARCLSQVGRFDEARVALENFQAANDEAQAGRLLTQAGAYLDRARRASEAAVAVEAAVAEPEAAAEAAVEAAPAEEPSVEAAPAEEPEEEAAADKPAKKSQGKKKSGKKSQKSGK